MGSDIMKKNIAYYQQAIMNEVMKEFTTRDIADAMHINDISVYSSDFESITFRKDKDVNITDNMIVKTFTKAIRKLVQESDDIEDIMTDVYDFKYNEKYITDGYVSTILQIIRSGKLIRIDIDC
jgi:hypothetical protein